jgi:hypothetical protein
MIAKCRRQEQPFEENNAMAIQRLLLAMMFVGLTLCAHADDKDKTKTAKKNDAAKHECKDCKKGDACKKCKKKGKKDYDRNGSIGNTIKNFWVHTVGGSIHHGLSDGADKIGNAFD